MTEFTFGEWLVEWFEVYKLPKIKPKSAEGIETVIRLHIPTELKSKALSDLRVFDIDKAISRMPPSRTQKLLFDTVSAALIKAYRIDLLSKNIGECLEPVRYKMKIGNALTLAEQEAFLIRISGYRLEPLFYFYLLTGVRRHEALTIIGRDIDFEQRTILIRGTKTANSFRVLPMTEEVEYILKEVYTSSSARLFPFNDDYVTKVFKKNCPNHKLHDLRHTFATRCAENNMQPSTVQKLLGHSKADMTMRIYTHVATEFVRSEYQKFQLNPTKKEY